jgi:hypothetical protein
MTSGELKRILIHRLAAIDDKPFLNTIKTIIEAKSKSTIYKTTPEQLRAVEEGRAQVTRGEYHTYEQVEMEIDQ